MEQIPHFSLIQSSVEEQIVQYTIHRRFCSASGISVSPLAWRVYRCRHEVPVTSQPITLVHIDEDIVVVNKPASIPVSGNWDSHVMCRFCHSSYTLCDFYVSCNTYTFYNITVHAWCRVVVSINIMYVFTISDSVSEYFECKYYFLI